VALRADWEPEPELRPSRSLKRGGPHDWRLVMTRLNLRAFVNHIGVVAVLLTLPSAALADQILEIHNDSLTTYLPTAKSSIQDIRPLVDQRGLNLDGSARLRSTHRMVAAGSPSGERWNGKQLMSAVRLDTGAFIVNDVDLSFPAQVPWVIGRSYNSRQKDSGGSYYASGGYQGQNWFQSSQPELVFYDSQTDSEDTIYLIYGADRFLEFNRAEDGQQQPSDDTFKAVNGAAGAILITTDAEGPDLATYYDQNGYRMVFFWFDDADIDDDIEGSIWKVVDPAGNAAYVGHETNASTALSSGYDATTGAITTAYDSAGRRFTYTYTSGMLTEVKAEDTPGTWNEVGKVQYSYYVAADSHGEDDDLELVTITTPLTDSGVSLVRKKYYWYYEGTYHATTNPGYHHQLQYVIDFEGYRKYDWLDQSLDDDPQSAAENDLKGYASAYFEYDTDRRIVSAWFNGACGCGGASTGTHTFEYESNGSYTDNSGYDTTWKSRTIVRKPDVTYKTASGATKSYITQYFDEVGQPLHRVHTADDPDTSSDLWATKVTRNSDGQITDIHSPANVTAYTHSTASFTTSTSAGLVTSFTRVSSGDMKGFLEDTKHKKGTSGSAYLDGTVEYTSATKTVGDVTVTRPLVNSRWVYSQETTTEKDSSGDETTFSYTMWTGDAALMPKQVTTTHPAVSTSKNGSGSSTTSKRYLRKDGTTAFTEAADGIFTYTQYTDGQLVKRIDDARTNHGSDFATGDDPNTDFGITETGDGVRRITTYAYDDQGRSDTVTQADGRVLKRYYSKFADSRQVTLGYNDYDSSPLKFYGPVQYTVANHAGRTEVQATVALTNNESTTALTGHVDETDSDPITAMDLGTVARMTVSVYDETGGVLQESRPYFDVPASGSGTEGTHYDATFFGYDDQGRRVRTKAPHGTITRTDHDTQGRVVSQWVGTNDSDFDGGESSGTDNMVKTVANQYDSGSDEANSYLTKRTLYVQDSDTDKRETTFSHDLRGRVLLQTNATAPHAFNRYDNMRRLIASGQFSATGSIDVASDDPTTETTNRLALSQTFYDERGRVWKRQRHQVDDADGSDDDNLQTLTWYDEGGRVIKADGAQLTKTFHDRLGRRTHRFVLSDDNDTGYSDADDVSGDHVLQERQTVYESTDSDDVVMTAVIGRYHDDWSIGGTETKGALDTNADNDDLKYTAANLEGRIQITAAWYDQFGRRTDSVAYGTNGGSDFDRDGLSVPARSDTALLTEYEYNTDGTLKEVVDPRNLKTRYEYDDAGRQSKVVNNYTDFSPSADTDQTTKYEYTDGLRTKLIADLPTGQNDQETVYTYGTTKGASAGDSKIATGHLLQKVQYPDSSGGTDVVTFAYNAQSQQIWTQDQAGNVIETDYDDSGRETHRRVTTLDSDFDGAVRRISTTYDNLGRRQLVTQYDNATAGSGSVVDEVKYTYEDWGNLEKSEQDHNSAVGATGSVDDYEVSYTYAKATGGRNTIRRSGMTLPDGTALTYTYRAGGRMDANASRVTYVQVGGTTRAEYAYNGVGQVVGITYPEPDVMSQQFGSTSGSYPDLDRFNRVTSSRWTKDLLTDVDFYDLDISYDRNSNITLAEDNVHAGFDVDYTIDNLNRLRQAEEGTWNGSSITSRTRQQIWEDTSSNLGLDLVGNWDDVLLDLDGDGNFTGTGEYKDDRTHNDGNELSGRDTDDSGSDDYTLTHDQVGNLTDDGEHYEYEYDAFGRLRKVKDTGDQSLVAEYTYNGLGYRIGWHYDVDADGTVESTSDDPWYYFAYDERWRIVATFRTDDSDPKEQFVYHNAGNDGRGSSSYIDTVILRDKDANTDWDTESDGTLEERIYHCHNWRADVVALVTDTGQQVEQVRYSAYGIPFGLRAGDVDSDGDVDSTDTNQIQTWIDTSAYDVRGDLDLNGVVATADKTAASGNLGKSGWGVLSDVGNRKGYAGYELDDALADAYRLYHVRNRVFNSDLGRWIRRDPLEYADGASLYVYGRSNPLAGVDPMGTIYDALRWKSRVIYHLFFPGPGGPSGPGGNPCASCPPFQFTPPGPPQIPCCPPVEPDVDYYDNWCRDIQGGGHCGAECYRSVQTPGTGATGGQQCCYMNFLLLTDPDCMGTIDRCGCARGSHTGNDMCEYDLDCVDDCHDPQDVDPYDDDPVRYNEIQCCMRDLGICSGSTGIAGPTDEELTKAYERCECLVDNDCGDYCN
jgi:RHS repeat-associated protein